MALKEKEQEGYAITYDQGNWVVVLVGGVDNVWSKIEDSKTSSIKCLLD